MRILLVEDEHGHSSAFKESLEDLGYRDTPKLTIVENSQKATEYLKKTKFDVVFMDISLKGSEMNGIELTRWIRKANKALPIVVYSISRDEKDERQAYEAGANLYVSKPYDLDKLLTMQSYVISAISNDEPLVA